MFEFLITFNLLIILPIIIFGLLYHIFCKRSISNINESIGWKGVVIFGFIGTSIHELSHLLIALLFRFRIQEVKLFRPIKGKQDRVLGYVSYTYNKRSLYQKIGNFFVGIAPMIGGSLCIVGLLKLLLPQLCNSLMKIESISIKAIYTTIIHSKIDIIPLILFLFLTISIVSHMSISSLDLKNASYGVIWLELLVLLISIIAFNLDIDLSTYIINPSIFLIFIFILGFIFSFITFIITDIIKK